ncbi:MAG: hypothetical protein RL662_1511 [Bacteroidota bacterium]|jgi:hypothetical protein
MRTKYSIILLIASFLVFVQQIRSQTVQLSDSSRISLITNTPWNGAVYALFGHTAIRVTDVSADVDVVFNYGLFDFDSPNFMYRFAKGETDYSVGYTFFPNYLSIYQLNDIGISEQILNLTLAERQKIVDALLLNCKPENKTYRYNYFYDNCSTRPRDIIENNVSGKIVYQTSPETSPSTYRKLVHESVNSEPWVRFGIDLVIGSAADGDGITQRQEHFLPKYLQHDFTNAVIQNSDATQRRLVLKENELTKPISRFVGDNLIDTPLLIGIILLIISVLVSFISFTKDKTFISNLFDTLLFAIAGVAGSIIFFLMFFSVHPCTNPNWNLMWLNPLQLICSFLFLIKFFSKAIYYYHFINFVLLIIFLLAWFLITPQYVELAFLPYVLALAIRSGIHIVQYRRKFKIETDRL